MRSCPVWFQDELTRIGGTNPYGESVFRLVWSTEERTVFGGRWADGYEGYRNVPAIQCEPCWALMVWEPRDMQGSFEMWEVDYRDEETGLLSCGGYPKYGRYRLLKKFTHSEIVNRPMWRQVGYGKHATLERKVAPEIKHYRMEPTGVILDLMVPMLMQWRKLSNEAKVKALQQREKEQQDEFVKKAKDIREGCRVMRGGQLVRKRAELIEQGMHQAMKIAAQSGLGMRIGD